MMTLFEKSPDQKKYRAPTAHDLYCVSKENESLFSFLRFTFSSRQRNLTEGILTV